MRFIIVNKYTRRGVAQDSNFMYLFNDNTDRTSRPTAETDNIDPDSWYYQKYKQHLPLHYGSLNNPTSAVIRGLTNAYPISTLKHYGVNWLASDEELFQATILAEIEQIKENIKDFYGIKVSNSRIGQGGKFARLPNSLQIFLDDQLKKLGLDNTGEFPEALNSYPSIF